MQNAEHFRGAVLHSSAYRDKRTLKGKRVLVVGCGETGLDIVHRAITAPARSVALAVRRGFLSVPTEGAGDGVPLDSMIANLFECAYVHRWAEALKLRWRVTTWFIRAGFWLSTGSSCGFNQWAGGLAPSTVRRGAHIVNKSTRAVPYLNRPLKRRSWAGRALWGWADRLLEPGFTLDDDDSNSNGGSSVCADVSVVRASPARARVRLAEVGRVVQRVAVEPRLHRRRLRRANSSRQRRLFSRDAPVADAHPHMARRKQRGEDAVAVLVPARRVHVERVAVRRHVGRRHAL